MMQARRRLTMSSAVMLRHSEASGVFSRHDNIQILYYFPHRRDDRTKGQPMTFARWVFLLAGMFGLAVLLPQFFAEGRIVRDYPPPITHPEFFYGFLGVGVAWQLVFLIISQ